MSSELSSYEVWFQRRFMRLFPQSKSHPKNLIEKTELLITSFFVTRCQEMNRSLKEKTTMNCPARHARSGHLASHQPGV